MQLFVKVVPLSAGTGQASSGGELLRCPDDVGSDTLLSFLTQLFGDVIDTAWTSTERHERLACGWIFAGPGERKGQQVLCAPFVAANDGSLRSLFELMADQHVEFEELARSGELDDFKVITLPHRTYRPAAETDTGQASRVSPASESSNASGAEGESPPEPGGRAASRPARAVSTGGGHRHGAGRAGSAEFPASWSDDEVIANILSVARDPDLKPVWQANQRWRVRGVRDGVEIFVIVQRDGAVATAWPVPGGRGVQQNPTWSMNPDEARLARMMKRLPGRFCDRLNAEDIVALLAMAEAGEWAEEADLLIATLAAGQQSVTDEERCDLADVLVQVNLPADQLAKIPPTGS